MQIAGTQTIQTLTSLRAPTAPKKRPSIRAKTSKSTAVTPSTSTTQSNPGSGLLPRPRPSSSSFAPSASSSTFLNSKTDKRLIKSSAFRARIEKTNRKPLKRRRANKKLVTTLESLADALPDVEDLVKRKEGGWEGKGGQKSLSHGKGYMKRRDKVEKGERERFGKNLGFIMANQGGTAAPQTSATTQGAEAEKKPSATAGRFAAIRAWVNENMEKHEGFEKKG